MSRCVVDTNVPIVANGDSGPDDPGSPIVECCIAAVAFLLELFASGKLLLDRAGRIQAEYRRHLCPRGQPGVGDRFYREVLNSAPHFVERIDLPQRDDGEYVDLPQALIDAGFDPSDRKFAALARRENAPVVNATDSDWLNHRVTLLETGICVRFICGCDTPMWFER